MTFLQIIKNHFGSHGIANPITFLAKKGDVIPDTIYNYCQLIEAGIGRSRDRIDLKIVKWLLWESWDVMELTGHNPVEIYLTQKMKEYEAVRESETEAVSDGTS